jgi:hypothetical protein
MLSDFTVLRRTWWKKWVNCAVLTGNSAGLRTVLASSLSHRELHGSHRESHSFLSLPAETTMASSQGTQQNWQKKTDEPDGETCAVPENIQFSFSYNFFTQLKCKCPNNFNGMDTSKGWKREDCQKKLWNGVHREEENEVDLTVPGRKGLEDWWEKMG